MSNGTIEEHRQRAGARTRTVSAARTFWLDWAPMVLLGLAAVLACAIRLGTTLDAEHLAPAGSGPERPYTIVESERRPPDGPMPRSTQGTLPSKARNLPS